MKYRLNLGKPPHESRVKIRQGQEHYLVQAGGQVRPEDFASAEEIFQGLHSLPLHPKMTGRTQWMLSSLPGISSLLTACPSACRAAKELRVVLLHPEA